MSRGLIARPDAMSALGQFLDPVYRGGETKSFDSDICYWDGQFTKYPVGTQG